MRLGLTMDVERSALNGSATDGEDFTSDTDAAPNSSSESESAMVLAVVDVPPLESDIGMAGPEGSVSDEEDGDHPHHVLLSDKLRHLAADTRSTLAGVIQQLVIAAWSLDDLRPADVPLTHLFELEDQNRITHMACRLPPRHNEVVREKID